MISPPKCTAFGQPAQSQCDIFVVASDEQMDYNSIQTAHSCFFTHKQWWVRGRVFLVHFVLKLACFQIAWWVSTFCNDRGLRSANGVWLAAPNGTQSLLHSQTVVSGWTRIFPFHFVLKLACFQIAWWVSTFCNDRGLRSANEVWLASRHEVSPSKLFSWSLISNVWGNTSFNRSLMLTVSFKVNFLLHTARLQIAC
jgi:hypothetical protein